MTSSTCIDDLTRFRIKGPVTAAIPPRDLQPVRSVLGESTAITTGGTGPTSPASSDHPTMTSRSLPHLAHKCSADKSSVA